MARVREEMHAAVTTGAAGSSGIPCAMGYGLYALSLGTGVIAPIVARRKCVVAFATMRDRIARASAPGGQDHTISPSVSKADRLSARYGHRFPASRVVTIAIRPSCRGGMTRSKHEF